MLGGYDKPSIKDCRRAHFGLHYRMASLGPVHTVIILLVLALFAVPVAIILKRAGFHPAWALLALVPGGVFVGLWIFALAQWPVLIGPNGPPPPPKKRWGPA